MDDDGRPVVLIVDDHADSRELLATVLQDVGLATAEAGTGRDAIRRIGTRPVPNLILLDLTLPDCHGTDVVRQVKHNPATERIPVVVLSAAVRTADKEAAARAGCVAFIEKPVLPDHVVSLVRRLLSGATA